MKRQILFVETLISMGPRGVFAISAENWRYHTVCKIRKGIFAYIPYLYRQF